MKHSSLKKADECSGAMESIGEQGGESSRGYQRRLEGAVISPWRPQGMLDLGDGWF